MTVAFSSMKVRPLVHVEWNDESEMYYFSGKYI